MVDDVFDNQSTLFPLPYRYIIDTCSILSQKPDEPHRRSVYKSLWKKLDALIASREIVICTEVKEEVEDEDILTWLGMSGCVVLDVDSGIQNNVIRIVNDHPEILDFSNMKSSGDAFLIATAMKYELAVITEESKISTKKIPKICEAYNIPCFNLTELADIEGWTF